MSVKLKCSRCNNLSSPQKSLNCVACGNVYHFGCVPIGTITNLRNACKNAKNQGICLDCAEDVASKLHLMGAHPQIQEHEVDDTDCKSDVEKLLRKVTRIESKMSVITRELALMKTENSYLKKINDQLTEKMDLLENLVEEMEKLSRIANIEVLGIPEVADENCLDIVSKIGEKLDLETDGQILTAYRVESKNISTPRPIVANMKNKSVKHLWIKTFNARRISFNIRDIITESECKHFIDIREQLTAESKHLLYLTRKFCKEYNYKFNWTLDGDIFVKKNQESNTEIVHVKNIEHLKKLDVLNKLEQYFK